MKITENITEPFKIVEASDNELNEGVLMRTVHNICNIGQRNRNNRKYSRECWDKVLKDPEILEKLNGRSLFGLAEHPADTQGDLTKVSHVITKIWIDEKENRVYQEMDILDTPYGRILETLLKAKCGVGVSTRADGELEESEDDEGKFMNVKPQTYEYVSTDYTIDPSTLGAAPVSVKKNVFNTVKTAVEAHSIDNKFATCLMESIQTDESKKLVETMNVKEKEVTEDRDPDEWGYRYQVLLNGKEIDVIYSHDEGEPPRFRQHLIDDEGFDSDIEVVKVRYDDPPGEYSDRDLGNDVDESADSEYEHQLAMGIEIEKEHTDNPEIAKKIATDHLKEDPIYYTKLKRMEAGECDENKIVETFGVGDLVTVNAGKYKDAQGVVTSFAKDANAYNVKFEDGTIATIFPADISKTPGDAAGKSAAEEKIVKKGDKWEVQSSKGKNMGTYDTEEDAKKRLKQVEFFKHQKESRTINKYSLTEERYKSDADIAKEFDGMKIQSIDVQSIDVESSRSSGWITIEFPEAGEHVGGGANEVTDGWKKYSNGKIAFENWYPEHIYNELVAAIEKELASISADGSTPTFKYYNPYESKLKDGNGFDKHRLDIAKKTLKMSDSGAKIMGGMSKEEARAFLKSKGYTDAQIAKLEESKLKEIALFSMTPEQKIAYIKSSLRMLTDEQARRLYFILVGPSDVERVDPDTLQASALADADAMWVTIGYLRALPNIAKVKSNNPEPITNKALPESASKTSSLLSEYKSIQIKEAKTRADLEKAVEMIRTLECRTSNKLVEKKALFSALEEKSKEVNKLSTQIKEISTKYDKRLLDVEDRNSRTLRKIKEQHKKEIISIYITTELKHKGLQLSENSLALLRECTTIKDVDKALENLIDDLREKALHSNDTGDVTIEVSEQIDPNAKYVKNMITTLMEHM